VSAREVVIELGDALATELEVRGTTLGAVITSRNDARRLALCMPSTRTAIELKTLYHRNPNRRWLVNDINDLDALAVAVPYCDIVFADAAATSVLVDGHIGSLMKTEIPRRPAELANLLQAI
jgi:acyl-homoserine lactone acylase PvdQ